MSKNQISQRKGVPDSKIEEQAPSLVSRRQILGAAGLAVLTATVISESDAILDSVTHQTLAEERFLNFPNSFPGVRDIQKMRWRGSTHCMVHIMQQHTKFSSSDKDLQGAKLSQASIRDVLIGFRDDPRIQLSSVFGEGEVGPGFVSEMKLIDLIFKAAAGDSAAGQLFMKSWPTFSPELQQAIRKMVGDPARMRRIAEFPGIFSALHDVKQMGIEICPGENDSLKAQEGDKYHVVESRNREILRKAVASGEPLSFAVFGSAHYFKNTISLWNTENPDHKFSLITVMPEGTYQARQRGLYTKDPNFDPRK